MSSLAQEESRSISENVRWGKKKSMADGNVYMPYGHFLGYRKGADGRPEIVEEEAAVIREIYDLFLGGKSITQIAEELTMRGVTTPGGKKKWNISTVRSILGNEKYKGDAILQKTYTVDYLTKEARKNTGELAKYIVHASHEPIIPPDVFERTQRELSRRRSARGRRSGTDSVFNQRLVCADCGGFYGHKVWWSHAHKHRYDVWYCNHRYDGEEKCQAPTPREDDVKRAFVKVLRELGRSDTEFSETLWRKLVETVTINRNRRAVFRLANGEDVSVNI